MAMAASWVHFTRQLNSTHTLLFGSQGSHLRRCDGFMWEGHMCCRSTAGIPAASIKYVVIGDRTLPMMYETTRSERSHEGVWQPKAMPAHRRSAPSRATRRFRLASNLCCLPSSSRCAIAARAACRPVSHTRRTPALLPCPPKQAVRFVNGGWWTSSTASAGCVGKPQSSPQ